jgi:hypothetical protein
MNHVYIDFKPNGTPFYVGIGSARRVKVARRNRHHSNVCKKYKDWYRVVVESTEDYDLCKEFEIFLISEIGRKDLHDGPLVNYTDGGDGVKGLVFSEESRAKLSKARLGNTHLLGYVPTQETRRKISRANMGRKHTPEAKVNMSNAQRGENHPMYGKTHKDSSKLKTSQSTKGKVWITNGETESLIRLVCGVPLGWELGRINGKSRKADRSPEATARRSEAAKRGAKK